MLDATGEKRAKDPAHLAPAPVYSERSIPPHETPPVQQPPSDDSKSRRSVLQLIAERTGLAPKVMLTEVGSEHGASPVIDPRSPASKVTPEGRTKYQLAGEIARGGMGVVLKGHDTDLGRDVALKVLDKELAKNPAVVQRFVEEAQIGGQLQHPGIVPVYELGLMADDSPYFTMKLVKGRTLLALFTQRKSPADNRGRMLAIFESVCQTMAYAHSKGVLHRDLKPANIMVGAFGEVQVVDWGLAKVLHRGGVADERRAKESLHTVIETVRSGPGSSGSDSLVGSVMGTPAYMAPEQAQGEVEKLDERADVFSLGAILCELLTGRPPYEEKEGESVVVQAARAQLDPARARIEACDADPVLVRLCLDCLMPARAARPANAEAVATAIHEYLVNVEERAHKAELSATEARIKAAEERRRRRLAVALAGTIVTALALGGGAYYWVTTERAQRLAEHAQRIEQTRTAVEAAHGESIEFGRAGKPAEALAAARRALAVAETSEVDAALLERARGFVTQAQSDLDTAERERSLRAQDETLRLRLVDLRLEQIDALGNAERETALDAAFAQAFHDYGVDLEGDDLVPALKRIRERAIAEEVALALDDWGRVRRRVHGKSSEKFENLLYLAMDLDPEPGRMKLRQAIFESDLPALLELTAPERLGSLAPGSIWVLSATLWDRYPDHRPEVYRMYDQALSLYPGDFVLQSIGGNIYQAAGRFQAALACRSAALGLRPDDRRTRMVIAESMWALGRLTDAEGAYRACIAANPTFADPNYNLSLVLQQLGDNAGALASITRALAIRDDPEWHPDLLAMRFYSGVASKEELVAALANATQPIVVATYLYPLLDHPDPARRDPAFVLRSLAEFRKLMEFPDFDWLFETVARIRSEDWSGAATAIEGHYKVPDALIVTPNSFDFMRALIYSHLGRDGEARENYKRGMVEWNAQTGGNPAAWDKSDAMRWRREAEAVLAK
ncbi:MAG: protein kinase [Planctomycetes bacterium]|nr:protein kinase [Planctomycetota bacterium]